MKSKIKLNIAGSLLFAEVTVELPEDGDGISYLWFAADNQFLGTIDKQKDLLKLKEMINEALKTMKPKFKNQKEIT